MTKLPFIAIGRRMTVFYFVELPFTFKFDGMEGEMYIVEPS